MGSTSLDSNSLDLLVSLMEKQLELQLQYVELQKSQISLLSEKKATSSPVDEIAANPHRAPFILKPVTPMCVPEVESPPIGLRGVAPFATHPSESEPSVLRSKVAWAMPEDKSPDKRVAWAGAAPETEHPRAAWGFAEDKAPSPPGSSDSSKYAATLSLSATMPKGHQSCNNGGLGNLGAMQRRSPPQRKLEKKLSPPASTHQGAPSIVVQVRPYPGARLLDQDRQASKDSEHESKDSAHNPRVVKVRSPRRVEVSPKANALNDLVNSRTQSVEDEFPPPPPVIKEEEDESERKEDEAKDVPSVLKGKTPSGNTVRSSDSWQVELPTNPECTNNDSKRTITVLKAALETNTTSTVEDEPQQGRTGTVTQFSRTSLQILELLGMLPVNVAPKRRWLYKVLCAGYVVSFVVIVVMVAGRPAIFEHLNMFPWWVQLQHGVFFASLCIVWLLVRRQFAKPSVLGTLVEQTQHGQFAWSTIDWYGRLAMLLSIGLALSLYASSCGYIWLQHARNERELSWEDRAYLIVMLLFLVQPSVVMCCFPWLLFMVVQLHRHDLYRFSTAMQEGLQEGQDKKKIMTKLHKLEEAVASRLRQSSATWGFATVLLVLAGLDVGIAGMISLLVEQAPTPVLLSQTVIVAFSLVFLPVLLLGLTARVADFFHWELVPAINNPLTVLGQVWDQNNGSALLMHLQALQATWGICAGGLLVNTNGVTKFASGTLLTFLVAMFQVAARQI